MGIAAREFARREGCSDTLVRRAGKSGKLTVFEDGSYDPDQVGTDWRPRAKEVRTAAANKGANKRQPSKPANTPLSDALLRKETSLAGIKELEYRTRAAELIELALAQRVLFAAFREQRDAWLKWPTKIAPLLAADLGIDADRILEALNRYVHRQISELGEPTGEFDERP